MNKEEEEEALIPILEKTEDYENFLKQAYLEICKYKMIDRVEWLLQEKK